MIGAMDQQITFQRAADTADGAGGITQAWANIAANPTVWANVKAKSGREALNEGRMTAVFVTVFTIYHRSDISELDRIVWNGENYNIRAILRTSGREMRLQIEAERGVAQ